MIASSEYELARNEAIKRARLILAGELDVLYGSIVLAEVVNKLVPDWRVDPVLTVFNVVASDSDHIPLGPARQQWKGEALARMDAMAKRLADDRRDIVFSACKYVVARFENCVQEF